MRRPILDSGTAHILVEVSKAAPDVGVDILNKIVARDMRRLRRELQASGKLVLRAYKIISGLDVKVFADWVVLGKKDTRSAREKAAKEASLGGSSGRSSTV